MRSAAYIVPICVVSVVLILFAGMAGAIQVGRTVEYRGGNMGRVIFDGRVHNDAGYHCMKCHNEYFIPKIGAAKITYPGHSDRKAFCFGCHDGGRAFDALKNCNSCHKK